MDFKVFWSHTIISVPNHQASNGQAERRNKLLKIYFALMQLSKEEIGKFFCKWQPWRIISVV
jgi:hypothetical protein